LNILNFYVRASLHVSLAVVSFTLITYYLFEIPTDFSVLLFVCCSTLVGYNYTKHTKYLFSKQTSFEIKTIQIITFFALFLGAWSFFGLNLKSKILVGFVSIFTILYAFEFFNGKNIRNQSGIKIYVVAVCWICTTLFLPIFQSEYPINSDVLVNGIQRFLFVIILILIFEIIDLKEDSPRLKTVPQIIGVKNTKIVSILLLFIFFGLELLLSQHKNTTILINSITSAIVFMFIVFASESRSKYYTTFLVESIPIFWFLLLFFLGY